MNALVCLGLQAAIDYRPHVVLLDIGLPGMDGYQIAQSMRQQLMFDQVVLVAITGYGTGSDLKRSSDAGFDHHLIKPPDFHKLRRILSFAAENAQ